MRGASRIPRPFVAALLALGLTAAACGGAESSDGVDTGGDEPNEAGANAGDLVGSGVNDVDASGDESTTTESTEAPPPTDTTAPPVTAATTPPTVRPTTPPQTSPPQTSPPQTSARPAPNVVGADSLGGDRRTVYDQVLGGMALEAGLNDRAQFWSGQGNSAADPWVDSGGGSSPWSSASEVSAQGGDVNSVIATLRTRTGEWAGFSHAGVGVTSGSGTVRVVLRFARQ